MIRFVINLYVVVIIIDAILSFIPQVRLHPAVITLRRVADVTLRPVRHYLPTDMPFDLAPIVVIFLLNLIKVLW